MDERSSHFADPSTVEARRTSFGAGAVTYDAVRPAWDEATVDWMLGHPTEPLHVLDVGAGTGLGTRTIAGLGHTVVALDPSAEMLGVLAASSARLAAEVARRIRTRVGPAERLADDDATYDAVTSFQAWHWVDQTRAARECARVLVPGGWLSLAWNSWAGDVGWLHELGDIVGTPEMIWGPGTRGAASDPEGIDGFEPAENTQFSTEQWLDADGLARLASSWSPVAVRQDRDVVLAAVRDLGARVAGPDGTLVFPYVSDCFRFRRA